MTINILKTESFLPLGKAIPRPIAEKTFTPEQVSPGVFKGADGKLYTDFKEHETPAVSHPPKQRVPTPLPTLPVLPNALMEWGGGLCPVSSGSVVEFRFRCETSTTFTKRPEDIRWNHINGSRAWDIVAYRVLSNAAE